jgi:pyruvate dehydrogenase E2 component (dihydrolipoamide acetyltransferase)
MTIDILMPALSPTMEEGTLAKWHVKAGDRVRAGDVIAEIETDKATMEVEAVDEGVVDEILVPEGAEEVKINTPIARLKGQGAQVSPPPTVAPPAPPPKGEEGEKRGRALGADHASANDLAIAAPNGRPEGRPGPKPGGGGLVAAHAPAGERILASPLARRLAERGGLELGAVQGTGPHGRIIQRDIEAAAKAAPPAPTKPAAHPPREAQSLEHYGVLAGSYDLIPLTSVQRTIARRMTDSFREVPHFTLAVDLEIDALLAARARINALLVNEGVKVSVNDIIVKTAAVALMRAPETNASYTPDGIAMHHHADIAMAVAIDGGLITPIVRAAETKGLGQIAMETKDLVERARARKLKPEEFQGGSFSVSNLGMFGIGWFSSIINEPHGAILSVGAGEKRPVARGDQLAVATIMSVTLTCDHRVVDGATGARFLQIFKVLIEDPLTMLV